MSWSTTEDRMSHRLAGRLELFDNFETEVGFEGRLISPHGAECPRNVHMLGMALSVAQIRREQCPS